MWPSWPVFESTMIAPARRKRARTCRSARRQSAGETRRHSTSRSASRGRERRARSRGACRASVDDPRSRTRRAGASDAGLVLREDAVWIVQMPAASVEATSASSSTRPTPRPRASSATYTLFSTTRRTRSGSETRRRRPNRRPPRCRARRPVLRRCPVSQRSQLGTSVSKRRVAGRDPLRVDPGHVGPVLGTEGRSRHRTGQVFMSSPLALRPRRLRALGRIPRSENYAHLPRARAPGGRPPSASSDGAGPWAVRGRATR